jgi:hypothetical protein
LDIVSPAFQALPPFLGVFAFRRPRAMFLHPSHLPFCSFREIFIDLVTIFCYTIEVWLVSAHHAFLFGCPNRISKKGSRSDERTLILALDEAKVPTPNANLG